MEPRRLPEKLRIRPKRLAEHLARITGQSTDAKAYYSGDEKKLPSSIIFIKPFKLLVTFEKAIRASVHDVEIRIAEKEAEATPEVLEGVKEKEKANEYSDKDLLIDLKLLVEFLDVDLGPTFEAREKIQNGTATTIEYQDLWHLFKLGDDVVLQSSAMTVYRVVSKTVRISLCIPFISPVVITGVY